MDALETRLSGALSEISDMAPQPISSFRATGRTAQARRMAPALVVAGLVAALIVVPALLATSFDGEGETPVADGTAAKPARSSLPPSTRSEVDRMAGRLIAFEGESDYGRTAVNYDARRVTLFWKGTPSRSVQEVIDSAPAGVSVLVKKAPYSAAELIAAGSRIISASQSGRWDTSLVSAAPTKDLSGLVVKALNPDEVSPQELARVAGVPVVVRQGSPVHEL